MGTNKISKAKAEKVLAAVKAQYKSYLEPLVLPAGIDPVTGVSYPEETLSPTYTSLPVLLEDWDGPGWVISWEEGPDEWAFRVSEGGPSEEERVLAHDAAKEFGVEYTVPKGPAPATIPKSVFVEPYNSFTLGLYPI